MATLIRADGTQQEVKPAHGKKFTLQELQKFVGGYIEAVPTVKRRHMYVNEEGRLIGLPFNERATLLMTPEYLAAGNLIVGDAILMEKGEG